jgi:hypothetical protein
MPGPPSSGETNAKPFITQLVTDKPFRLKIMAFKPFV